MFTYSTNETVIPSLSFTKAELAYALFVLMKDIPLCNISTGIELVEVRHYLNQIGDKVLLSTHDGTLKQAVADSIGTKESIKIEEPKNNTSSPAIPSMDDLKRQFPNLTESEISDILESAKQEQRKKDEDERKKPTPPPLPSFKVKPKQEGIGFPVPEATQKPSVSEDDIDEAERFARLLGSF